MATLLFASSILQFELANTHPNERSYLFLGIFFLLFAVGTIYAGLLSIDVKQPKKVKKVDSNNAKDTDDSPQNPPG